MHARTGTLQVSPDKVDAASDAAESAEASSEPVREVFELVFDDQV